MLSLVGLTLNTLGTFHILVPDIPQLYRGAHRFPPLKIKTKKEEAEVEEAAAALEQADDEEPVPVSNDD